MAFDLEEVKRDIQEAFEEIGLHLLGEIYVGAVPREGEDLSSEFEPPDDDDDEFQGPSPEDLMKSGKVDFFAGMTLSIGELAWSERVLDPKAYAEKQEFLTIAPSNAEMLKQQAKEEMKKLLEEDEDD